MPIHVNMMKFYYLNNIIMGNVVKRQRGKRIASRISRLPIRIRVMILLYINEPEIYKSLPRLFVDHSGLIDALDKTDKFGEYVQVWTVLCTKFGVDISKIHSVKPVVGCGRIARHMSNKYSFRSLLNYMDTKDILMYVANSFKRVSHIASSHFISANFGDKEGPLDTTVSLYTDQFGSDIIIVTINGEIRDTISGPTGSMKKICDHLKDEIRSCASSSSSSNSKVFTMIDLGTKELIGKPIGEVTKKSRMAISCYEIRRKHDASISNDSLDCVRTEPHDSFYYISPKTLSPPDE